MSLGRQPRITSRRACPCENTPSVPSSRPLSRALAISERMSFDSTRAAIAKTLHLPRLGLKGLGDLGQFVMAHGNRAQINTEGLDDAAVGVALAVAPAGGAVAPGDQTDTRQTTQQRAHPTLRKRQAMGQPGIGRPTRGPMPPGFQSIAFDEAKSWSSSAIDAILSPRAGAARLTILKAAPRETSGAPSWW